MVTEENLTWTMLCDARSDPELAADAMIAMDDPTRHGGELRQRFINQQRESRCRIAAALNARRNPVPTDIVFSTAPDERFVGRTILIGTVPGGRTFYASFVGRQEKAEAYIREAVNIANSKEQCK